jgi:hypothetical protein
VPPVMVPSLSSATRTKDPPGNLAMPVQLKLAPTGFLVLPALVAVQTIRILPTTLPSIARGLVESSMSPGLKRCDAVVECGLRRVVKELESRAFVKFLEVTVVPPIALAELTGTERTQELRTTADAQMFLKAFVRFSVVSSLGGAMSCSIRATYTASKVAD